MFKSLYIIFCLDLVVQCEVLDVTCGNLGDFYSLSKEITYDCTYYGDERVNWDVCILQCPVDENNDQLYPTHIDTIYCDQDSGEWETPGSTNYQISSGTQIDCAETKCGYSNEWNFGMDGYQEMDRTCVYDAVSDMSICHLDCTLLSNSVGFVLDTAGNSFSNIVCGSDRELTPPEDTVNLVCAETPCGKLNLNVAIEDVIPSCDADGCDFSCADDAKIPSYKRLDCNKGNYDFKWGMDELNPFKCVTDRDTPCGDISSYFLIEDDVSVTCDTFESIYQTNSVDCIASCKSEDAVLIGDSELKCKNGNFQNSNKNIGCAATVCGEPSEHYNIKNLGTEISYTCENNACHFACTDPTHAPLISSVTCNKGTGKFNQITLFSKSEYPLGKLLIIRSV